MKRHWHLHLVFLAAMLLLVAGCGPFGRREPTAEPTIEAATQTAAPATRQATDTPVPPVSATSTKIALVTTEPPATATPQFTDAPTSIPPTATPPPTATAVPPTSTSAPTQTTQPTQTQAPPTATSTPTNTPLPPVVITDWRGEYFDNISLQGPARVVRNDLTVDINLSGGAAPAIGMPGQNWSARWTRNWTFEEGNYRFHLLVDDGARLWVGGKLLIDVWTDGPARVFTADLYLKGQVPIQVDYYNRLGDARIRLNWERVVSFDGWQGSYYANQSLSGLPLFQRDDLTISFNWGSGSPRNDLPADNFSVRWSRVLEFDRSGLYQFMIESDDGVRVWVDGLLLIDRWQDGQYSEGVRHELSAGKHDLRVEYYEHLGGALIQVSWEYLPATSTPTHTPVPPTSTFTPTPPPTVKPTKPPTPIPHPTATPSPIGPQIALEPSAGRIGVPFEVSGSQWPLDSLVDLFLVRPVAEPGDGELVASATTDGKGRFAIEIAIPADEGWEGLSEAIVEARARGNTDSVQATYEILPRLWEVKHSRVSTNEERYGLLEPTYLVLDNEEDWIEWFGQKPPQVKPPINWKTDIVLGAFLGEQAFEEDVDVDAVVQRDNVVSVWLTVAVPEDGNQDQSTASAPRVMIRVRRADLRGSEREEPADLVFAFLDVNGQLLAQGPAGGALPGALLRQPRLLESGSEVPEEELSDASQVEGEAAPQEEPVAVAEAPSPVSESAVEAERAIPLEPGQEVAEAPVEPEASLKQPADEAQPAGRDSTWFWVGGGIALLFGGAGALWFGRIVVRRRKGT